MPARFLDTNILLYAASLDTQEAAKRNIARQCIARQDWAISTQVLQEFYVNAVAAKGGRPALMTPEAAQQAVRQFGSFPCQATDLGLVLAAMGISHTHRLSYWDAAIVAAARNAGATQLLSEDLNHGQIIEGIEVVNPFLD